MKRIYLILFVISFASTLAFGQNFNWAVRAGKYAYDYGMGIGTDASGNLYVAGKYEETGAFFGDTTVFCEGNHDIFLAKYSSTGVFQWVRTAGGTMGDYAHASVTDAAGNTYMACEIEGSANFGTTVVPGNPGDNDAVICKYDANGNLLWANSAGGFDNDKALDIAIDAAGNSFITGKFRSTASFSGTTITSAGLDDIFIAKYNSAGVFQWVRRAGSTGYDQGKSIAVDAAGNAYVTGNFFGTADFSGTSMTAPNGYFDMYLAKYDTDGNLLWVKQAGGDYDDVGWAVAVDVNYRILVTGEFNAYATFGTNAIPTTGMANVFVAVYNSNGDNLWVRGAGGDLIDRAFGITSDVMGNIYYTGQFGSTGNFSGINITAADSGDIFVASMTPDGNARWALAAGGAADSSDALGYEAGISLVVAPNSKVYVTGSYLNSVNFNTNTLSPYSRTDIFIAEIDQVIAGVGLSETASGNIQVFPNPTNGLLHINTDGFNRDETTIMITDLLGKQVYISGFGKGSTHTIDLMKENIQGGVYFVKVSDSTRHITQKVISK